MQVARKVHFDTSPGRKVRANVVRNGVVVADRYKCCQRPVTVDAALINKHASMESSAQLFAN